MRVRRMCGVHSPGMYNFILDGKTYDVARIGGNAGRATFQHNRPTQLVSANNSSHNVTTCISTETVGLQVYEEAHTEPTQLLNVNGMVGDIDHHQVLNYQSLSVTSKLSDISFH